jgi:hypothetical protein
LKKASCYVGTLLTIISESDLSIMNRNDNLYNVRAYRNSLFQEEVYNLLLARLIIDYIRYIGNSSAIVYCTNGPFCHHSVNKNDPPWRILSLPAHSARSCRDPFLQYNRSIQDSSYVQCHYVIILGYGPRPTPAG